MKNKNKNKKPPISPEEMNILLEKALAFNEKLRELTDEELLQVVYGKIDYGSFENKVY